MSGDGDWILYALRVFNTATPLLMVAIMACVCGGVPFTNLVRDCLRRRDAAVVQKQAETAAAVQACLAVI